ncbi:UvrD-helicase domain-containing protein [Candidatus Woesearchaeota archaeon]|nr:UvrD-helicase domain-containing protein [Candidatus Woesearchaeota archaeon]
MGDLDHLNVLNGIKEIPFGVGKKLLIDFLSGNKDNESIQRNRLHKLKGFGSLAYNEDELAETIDKLLYNGLIAFVPVNGNKFWKVLELTEKGNNEIKNPTRKKFSFSFESTKISDEERKIFPEFGKFLEDLNDEQKKAVISDKRHILCVAGAGAGKTRVIAKRVEFLVTYKSIDPSAILAITFTRKARQEMANRLDSYNSSRIETFNSFCEKTLLRHNNLIYSRSVRMLNYHDKVMLFRNALSEMKLSTEKAIEKYFSHSQKKDKTIEQLGNTLVNDCFMIRDYFKLKNQEITDFTKNIEKKHIEAAEMMHSLTKSIEENMEKSGLRDHADQLVDTLNLFRSHPETIPKFEHILVDEYQDVNTIQIELLDIMSPKNIFCVGDPRQSIFGWRGSDIRHIINFQDKHPEPEIICLTKNYRSTMHIIDLMNKSIRNMRLPDVEASRHGEKDIRLLNFETEQAEFEFVIQRILSSGLNGKDIFVLSRTNRQLNDLSSAMKLRGIKHVVRTEETGKQTKQGDEVTLATIHAIKGMEAEMVFVMGCTSTNFPCKGSEHPIVDMVATEAYDKEEEERRVFYVALSRAKKSLYLTYPGNSITSFINEDMQKMLKETQLRLEPVKSGSSDVLSMLKKWRREQSLKFGTAPYMILHDRTIIEIAQRMPMTKDQLENINGLGPVKIMRYGEDILRIVNGL